MKSIGEAIKPFLVDPAQLRAYVRLVTIELDADPHIKREERKLDRSPGRLRRVLGKAAEVVRDCGTTTRAGLGIAASIDPLVTFSPILINLPSAQDSVMKRNTSMNHVQDRRV